MQAANKMKISRTGSHSKDTETLNKVVSCSGQRRLILLQPMPKEWAKSTKIVKVKKYLHSKWNKKIARMRRFLMRIQMVTLKISSKRLNTNKLSLQWMNVYRHQLQEKEVQVT